MDKDAKYNSSLVCIRKSFTESGGTIDKIEKGEKIDEIEVLLLEEALTELHGAWLEKDLVPKQDVQFLWNVFPRLEKCLILYPQRYEEINNFIANVSMWIERIFTTSPMSEEQAIAVVSQHIIGPSFLVDLLLANTVNEASIDELFFAVQTLAQAWKRKEHISKLAAGALISTQFMTVSDVYTQTEIHHLQAVRQQLIEHVTECFR